MGDVIRNSAAVDDIGDDTRTAHTNAIAKGGTAREIAEERLGPMVAMIDAIELELKEAKAVAKPLVAEVHAENDRADAALARIYDDIWNDVGRPANDRVLAVLFPGGTTYYADGDTEQQPDRMELLAQLLDRKLHPKLTAQQVTGYVARVREAVLALRTDVDAARIPVARVTLLERTRTALGRTAQFELASLKRAYKNEGMSEAEIHTIIPDRPPPKKKAQKPPQAPAPEPPKAPQAQAAPEPPKPPT